MVAKLPANLQPIISGLAGQAVAASEQSFAGAAGQAKFAAASTWLVSALARYGVKLTPDEIKSSIEEAVFYLNQSQGKSVASAAPAAA